MRERIERIGMFQPAVARLAATAAACMAALLAGCDLGAGAAASLVPPTVAEDSRLPSITVTVGGVARRIHARTFGDPAKPAMLVSPGSLSDSRAYLPFAAFADRYYMVVWDQRGAGLSERVPAGELGAAGMAEEMHQVKLHFSPSAPVTVVGHSWSAVFAAMYCARYPAEVAEAVLMEPPGFKAEFNAGLQNVLNLTTVAYADMNWFGATLSPTDHGNLDLAMLAMLDSGIRNFYVDPARKPDWPVWRVGGLALIVWENEVLDAAGQWNFDYTAGMSGFAKPVLFVGSSHSPIGYEYQKATNATAFPGSSLLRIDQAGHRIITEQWARLESGLRGFLAQYRP